MPFCVKCHQNEATIHFIQKVNGNEKVNVHRCEGCARPAMDRLEASRQGPKKCDFCGAAAFGLVPGAMNPIYECCGCSA